MGTATLTERAYAIVIGGHWATPRTAIVRCGRAPPSDAHRQTDRASAGAI